MVMKRVYRGISDHFPMRVTEWVMVIPALGIGFALNIQSNMFSTSPSFGTLASWASEPVWAISVLTCAFVRLMALIVNGTFNLFPYSPHLRAGASLIGMIFWSQFCLGFLVSAMFYGGSWSAPIIYMTVAIIEVINVYRSWADVGQVRGRNAYKVRVG